MAAIDIERVTSIFVRICGLDVGSGHSDLIVRAVNKIEKALTVPVLTYDQVLSCEYAAACEAAYEYALEEASHERFVLSGLGSARKRSADAMTVEAADGLRKHAFAELSGIAELGGFIFEAAEG